MRTGNLKGYVVRFYWHPNLAVFIALFLLACGPDEYAASVAAQLEYPEIPGLDFDDWDTPSPDRSLGALGSLDSLGSSGSMKGTYRIEGTGLLETDLKPVELIGHYRERMIQPSWDIQDEHSGNGAAWFMWTVPDSMGNLWYGSLVVTPAGQGWQQVWLSLHSSELR